MKSYTKITEILPGTYNGYIWYGNENKPEVFLNKPVTDSISLEAGTLPFIVEAQLCSTDYSYSIKMLDGEYFAIRYDLASLEGKDYVEHRYLSNLKASTGRLVFREYWHPVPDVENCEGMNVLQPGELVFVGFENKED